MAEVFSPLTLASLANQTSAINTINTNFATLATLLNDVLSRTGIAPNQMGANLDMNSNKILNLVTPLTASEPLRLGDINQVNFVTGSIVLPTPTTPTGVVTWTNATPNQLSNTGVLIDASNNLTVPGNVTVAGTLIKLNSIAADLFFNIVGAVAKNQGIQFNDSVLRWQLYKPASSTDLRFFDGTADRLILAAGGAVTIGGLLTAGTFTSSGAATFSTTLGVTGLTTLTTLTVTGAATLSSTLAVTAAVTLSNVLNLATGSATIAPLQFTSGTNLTSAVAGAMEYDGTSFYASPVASNRGLLLSAYSRALTTAATGTNGAAAQQWFPTSGKIAVATGVTYFFEGTLLMTTGATSHTLALGFGGTASITAIGYIAVDANTGAAVNTVASNVASLVTVNQASSTVVSANTTATAHCVTIRGTVTINVGGTLIPQFTFSVDPTGTISILPGTYFRLIPMGNTIVGNWT